MLCAYRSGRALDGGLPRKEIVAVDKGRNSGGGAHHHLLELAAEAAEGGKGKALVMRCRVTAQSPMRCGMAYRRATETPVGAEVLETPPILVAPPAARTRRFWSIFVQGKAPDKLRVHTKATQKCSRFEFFSKFVTFETDRNRLCVRYENLPRFSETVSIFKRTRHFLWPPTPACVYSDPGDLPLFVLLTSVEYTRGLLTVVFCFLRHV